jgi:hypothetical protein
MGIRIAIASKPSLPCVRSISMPRHGQQMQADIANALKELREGKQVPGSGTHTP